MTGQRTLSAAEIEHRHYCEQVAKGKITTKNGRPLTDLERFDCRKAVNQTAARKKGATTLYFLLYGLLIDDEINAQLLHPELSWMEWQARKLFVSIAAADIASGKLIIRDLFHFLQCNDSEEVRRHLNNDDHDDEWLEFSICVVVSYDDARSWLLRHKRKVPGWLCQDSSSIEKRGRPPAEVGDTGELLAKVLLGMAVAGYGYRLNGERNPAVGKIKAAIDKYKLVAGFSDDLISNRLKEARTKRALPIRADARSRVMVMIVSMAKSHWRYTEQDDQVVCKTISTDLETNGFSVSSQSIESLLIEAKRI